MKAFHCLLILSLSIPCFGQTKSEKESILKFKQDFMTGKAVYKPDTLVTSAAILTRVRGKSVRCISTFPKGQQVKYDECFYNDTNIPESTASYTLPEKRLTGISRKYDHNGSLEYTIDHDKGIWEVVNPGHYPYYPVLDRMKGIADSLIMAVYGDEFFKSSVVWMPLASVFYDGKFSGAGWCDEEVWEPKRYLLKYAIRMTKDEVYDDMIEVQLDSMGHLHFPFGQYDDIRGFDADHLGNGFALDRSSAIQKAKANGMVEDEDRKAISFLQWKYDDPHHTDMFNGHFLYSVVINTEIITQSSPTGWKRVEYKYNSYLFNPWSGEFIGKEKMKAYGLNGKAPHEKTPLMPDN